MFAQPRETCGPSAWGGPETAPQRGRPRLWAGLPTGPQRELRLAPGAPILYLLHNPPISTFAPSGASCAVSAAHLLRRGYDRAALGGDPVLDRVLVFRADL